jgi:hypothetical protein
MLLRPFLWLHSVFAALIVIYEKNGQITVSNCQKLIVITIEKGW